MDIQLLNIEKSYSGEKIYEDFSICFNSNEIVVLKGTSGCGKTTLINMIAGLETYDKGTIKGVPQKISYVFQEDRLFEWMTVRDNIEFVLKSNMKKGEINQRIDEVLKSVGLKEDENKYPSELSGGMKRRVALARAFAYGGDLILLDEPFTGLDIETKKQMIALFKRLWERDKTTALLVTHDEMVAKELAHKIYELKGRPVFYEEK